MLNIVNILILQLFFLAACSTVVEHVRIDVSENLASSIQVLVSETVSLKNIEEKTDTLEKYANKAKLCGASTRIFGGPSSMLLDAFSHKQLFLQAHIQLKTRDEIDIVARCGDFNNTHPKLFVSTSHTLLSTVYQFDVEMQSGMFDTLGKKFPKEISFTLPGEITEVVDNSHTIAHNITKTLNGDNRVTVYIEPIDEHSMKQLVAKLCGNRGLDCDLGGNNAQKSMETAMLKIENNTPESMRFAMLKINITAEKKKYDLRTILSILGLLFGSGIIFEVLKKFLSHNRTKR